MKLGFNKFIWVVIIIFCGIISSDVLIGKVFDNLLHHIGCEGQIGKTDYALNRVDAQIVIVGSSRAAHHYDSRIIADSTSKTAYNVGRDGCFFSHNCCLINSILDRYTPEVLVWEFSPEYLYEDRGQITSLYPYYSKNSYVTNLINEDVSWSEKVKLYSNIYRYNSLLIRILSRFSLSQAAFLDSNCGFEPLSPKEHLVPLELTEKKSSDSDDKSYDNESYKRNVSRLSYIINRAKTMGVKLILVTSPIYAICHDSDELELLKSLCSSENILYLDNRGLYLDNPTYFNDQTHMNSIGANQYTKSFVSMFK